MNEYASEIQFGCLKTGIINGNRVVRRLTTYPIYAIQYFITFAFFSGMILSGIRSITRAGWLLVFVSVCMCMI